MTLRRRLALGSAIAVAVTIAAASAIVYVVVREQLRDQVDSSLDQLAAGAAVTTAPAPLPAPLHQGAVAAIPLRPSDGRGSDRRGRRERARIALALPEEAPGLPLAYGQLVTARGDVLTPAQGVAAVPVTAAATEVAAGEHRPFYADVEVAGRHLRVLTTPIGGGQAIQVARSLEEVDTTLRHLAVLLGCVALAGIALAAILGRAISRSAIAPLARLTEAAEHVARTGDLARRIEVESDDETGRLAARFNEMLAELETAIGAQRQLVADASHELRTPLTSLRTNIETLARPNGMPDADRGRLLADVLGQMEELATLVANLVDLAREEQADEPTEDLRLDELVADAVARARRHAPDRRFVTRLEPCLVRGAAGRLDRAVSNLLDNAAKWSPAGGQVEVALDASGEVAVRDHGPGIDPADLPQVFDRFYRAASARAMAGSGLGLAIVRQVAVAHGGAVTAEAAAGGGTVLRLRLPTVSEAVEPAAALS